MLKVNDYTISGITIWENINAKKNINNYTLGYRTEEKISDTNDQNSNKKCICTISKCKRKINKVNWKLAETEVENLRNYMAKQNF